MVPVHGSPQSPCFPQCVEWILQNQQEDGSWGQPGAVNKDALLSTLACVLALNTWNVGPDHIRRGLNFIGRNFLVAMDGESVAPPCHLNELGNPCYQNKYRWDAGGTILARKAFMAYVSEGLGRLQDWDYVMAYQRKNGSFFNSPSTTAAAAIYSGNDRALDYLQSLTTKLGGPVPAIYPDNVYSRLCMVDTLEKMGISSEFACEIQDILDMTYRYLQLLLLRILP
ncbi:hypothetical protein OsI_36074 [Oryza sativa Indica Group]|uniref:Terpene synthase N-terminal domain-containing protein n=1 Tax=Oryza sativa subsp. indica TaxID=39946 RepID=B8BKG0_ORYSI|nr:hypothetical protein OsI_36074 [Oryza sativa Indica Group]